MQAIRPDEPETTLDLKTGALPPVLYAPSVERVEEDEAAAVAQIDRSLAKIAAITYQHSGRGLRAVHAKSQAILYGQLSIVDTLPAFLAQGLFGLPGTYPTVLRISTSPGDLLDDQVSTPRGLAMKVLGVRGERLPGSERESTQDFLMVNAPAFNRANAQRFSGALKLLALTTDRAEWAKKLLSALLRGMQKVLGALGLESGSLRGIGGEPLHHPLGETYFTAVPFRFGHYIAKFSLAPVSQELIALRGTSVNLEGQPDGLRLAVEKFFAVNDAIWELRVQLCRDLETMPVEDASVAWPQEQSPYLAVATLKVTAHAPMACEARHRAEDSLFFSPWQGLAAHQPLGSVNRARRSAYHQSGLARAERNGVPFEPQGDGPKGGRCPV